MLNCLSFGAAVALAVGGESGGAADVWAKADEAEIKSVAVKLASPTRVIVRLLFGVAGVREKDEDSSSLDGRQSRVEPATSAL
ncbi:MAG TPA: hypothetical protein VGL09_16320 [Methylomirabilota bacterium]